MSYSRINWQNNVTPLNAENMNKMDAAIAEHDDAIAAKVTVVDENSDNAHYPSAKAVYDYVAETLGEIENAAY